MIGAPRTQAQAALAKPRRASADHLRVEVWVLFALAALAVRLLYIFVIARAPVGIGGDAGFFHSAANEIADGHFYYRVIFGHAYKTAEHPPLYPLLLSVSSLLGWSTLLAHRIVSCMVGAIAVVLVGLLGEKVAGRRAGIIAASIAIFYPPFVTADGLVMSEPLFTVTVTAALLIAIGLRARPTRGRALALGGMIGLAALTRAEGLLLVPLLAWPASFARTPGVAWRMVAATAATAVVIAPWVIRNAVVFHRLTFSTNENTLIAGANCPDTYYGHDTGWWSLDCLASGRTRAQLDAGDASTSTALRYARHHLARLPVVMGARVLRTFDLLQPMRQGNREPRRRWVDVVGLIFYFPLLALAGAGLVLAWRRRPRPSSSLAVLLAPVWMVLITSALGWGIGRFRIAADVTIIVLAAGTLASAAGALADRGKLDREAL